MMAEMTNWAGNRACLPEIGQPYRDAASGTVVLVLTRPQCPGVLSYDGVAMLPGRPLPCSYRSHTATGAALRPGHRYCDPVSGLEVRCLRGGNGHRLAYSQWPLIPA